MMSIEQENNAAAEGVLLYYYFIPLSTRQLEEQQWYMDSCSDLKLVGRCRVARDGVNCTLGGNYQNLQKHASQVAERYNTDSIDFKLTISAGRKNEQSAAESKFNQLTVDIVKEVVTIGLDDLLEADGDVTAAPITARHASPLEFHHLLQNAANENAARTETSGAENSDDTVKKETVLVDCRNVYETRIGHFEAEGVITLDPGTRAFSDLPAWFESNARKLAGKRVLMCCTGGVRCERASAYLLTLGSCFQGNDDVVQLQGGIERYLEQFGQEGFFKGKNFVFDERGESEGILRLLKEEEKGLKPSDNSCSGTIRGACCVCTTPWGEYGARARCSACRMLVLLCDTCHSKTGNEDDKAGEITNQPMMLCELCQQQRSSTCDITTISTQQGPVPYYTNTNLNLPTSLLPSTRIRILCLHGFRQTARNFQGRTSALRRRLKHVAEFVFIDAPHTVPDIYGSMNRSQQRQEKKTREIENEESSAPFFIESNGTSTSPSIRPTTSNQDQWEQKRLRRGWLVSPEQYNTPHFLPRGDDLDHEQYHHQTAGLKESLDILDNVLDTQGPWDGILGFSQGASIAALLAARECHERPTKEERRFKFVICCSGYPSPLRNKEQEKTVLMPSLHVYGATKQDKQISEPESKSLWEQFDAAKRVLLRHNAGHVIPSTRLAAARIADFIAWAREEESKEH
ncbi:hypothetical protein Ndes2437B_g04392 [Nannochloris sp. 'desiccata']